MNSRRRKMTKQALQQELLEKVKPGTKPSQLKKSKSLNDLPSQPKNNSPKRKSLEVLPTSPSLKTQLEKAHDQISILELKLETQQRELDEKALAEKELKTKLTQTQTALDKSLEARQQNLKVFGKEHEKRQAVETELEETITQSAEELTQQDQALTNLRTQLFKANQQVTSLQQELNLMKIRGSS